MSMPRARLLAIALVLMPLLGLVPKYFLIERELAGQKIEQIGFGFGDYVDNLLHSGELRSCKLPPFASCQPDRCLYATRMPVIPLLYAGIARWVGAEAAVVDLVKCALTAVLLAGLLAVLVRDARPSLWGVLVLYVLYFGPQALKHGAAPEYEEGLLLDLELSLAITVSYLLRPELAATAARRITMGCIAVTIAVLMYFIKTTALLMLLVVIALFVARARAGWRLSAGMAVVVIAPFVAWAMHTAHGSNRIHLSSSWNGENLFRGYNSDSLAIYPQISLDRIFDAPRAVLDDGTTVELGDYAHHQQCFVDEWAWSESYSQRATAWLKSHPVEALRFDLRKLWVALVEIRHTPYRTDATRSDPEYPYGVAVAMAIWMVVARLIFFLLCFWLFAELAAGRRGMALWALALLAAGFAPYVMVFSYQRHVVPLLLMAGGLLVSCYALTPWRRTVT
jgi:hypothetical protein